MDVQIGHCNLDLFRLCKTAMNRFDESQVSNNPSDELFTTPRIEKTSISIARQLLKEGLPMQCLDRSTMEVLTLSTLFSFLPH